MRLILTLLCCASLALGGERPKVRAVTAFINIDPQHYDQQFDDTLKFLDSARKSYAAAGFEVEGVRIATQPFPVYTAGMKPDEALAFLGKIAALAHERHFGLNIGPAMLEDGDDTAPVDLLIRALVAGGVTSSLVIAGDDGIHWRAIGQAARLIKEVGAKSANGVGNFSFAAIAMVKPYGPFFPGAYHLGSGRVFAVAFEGASVVEEVFARFQEPRQAEQELTKALSKQMVDAEAVAVTLGKESGWAYGGIDPTPAPNGSVSIGHAIESFLGAPFGSSGTMTAASIITHAVQAVPIRRVGYSGLMVPVLEDETLAKRWAEGTYTADSLLAYSAVCAGGLDTVPLPGDISEAKIAHMLGDVASLAFKWRKPLAARLLPAPGKKAGDMTEFKGGKMLLNTTLR
jgi:uncharacterized protein (UPF0210 family)